MTNSKKATGLVAASLDPANDPSFQSAEECFHRRKPAIDALAANDVRVATIDVQEAAIVALGVDGLLREPSTRAKVASLVKVGLVNGKLLDELSDVARAAWFARYRLLQVSAVHSEATLPGPLVEGALSLRRRMLKTLDYNLDGDAEAMARLDAIRLGSGHLDMANDLLACADFYRERRSDIEQDQKNYRKGDEGEARHLADKVLRLLGAVTTPEQTLWRSNQARAFTLLLTHYEEARRVGRFLSYYEDADKLFPSLFSAVRAAPAPRAEKPAPAPAPTASAEAAN